MQQLLLLQAAFAASHKICIRYLKGENANTQLMYLGGVSLLGSLLMATLARQWTLPAASLDWMLLLLTGASVSIWVTDEPSHACEHLLCVGILKLLFISLMTGMTCTAGLQPGLLTNTQDPAGHCRCDLAALQHREPSMMPV